MPNDTKNFKAGEFACPCGCGKNEIRQELMDMLQNIRWAYNKPMSVNSGYRCPAHNAEIGGKPDSAHIWGYAADIACSDNHERYLLIRAGMKSLCTRMEANVGKGWVHFDCDPNKAQEVIF